MGTRRSRSFAAPPSIDEILAATVSIERTFPQLGTQMPAVATLQDIGVVQRVRVSDLGADLRTQEERARDELLLSKPLYKYLAAGHARALVERGSVRVGSLGYYRERERHDPLRGDSAEGSVAVTDGGVDSCLLSELTPLANGVVRSMIQAPGNIELKRVEMRLELEHADAYVYCLSHELSLSASGGAEACVRIGDPRHFFAKLTSALGRAIGERMAAAAVRPVVYGDRTSSAKLFGRVHPVFLKDRVKYSCEAEVRGAWLPARTSVRSFLDLEDRRLTRSLELVDIPLR